MVDCLGGLAAHFLLPVVNDAYLSYRRFFSHGPLRRPVTEAAVIGRGSSSSVDIRDRTWSRIALKFVFNENKMIQMERRTLEEGEG